jgi:hypothetical protein
MKDIVIVLFSVFGGALTTHLFTRQKYKADVENAEIDCTRKIVELYKQALTDVQLELSKAREEIALSRQEIAKLRKEVENLTKLNRTLETELKQVKKLQEQANDENNAGK